MTREDTVIQPCNSGVVAFFAKITRYDKNLISSMGRPQNIHVVRRNEGWVVRSEGTSKPTSVHQTQRDAVYAAREIARSRRGELIIHGRDGRIRDRDSYGSDRMPPRDRVVLFPSKRASVSGKAIKDAVSAVLRESKSSSHSSKHS
jgi:hypothetical protein